MGGVPFVPIFALAGEDISALSLPPGRGKGQRAANAHPDRALDRGAVVRQRCGWGVKVAPWGRRSPLIYPA